MHRHVSVQSAFEAPIKNPRVGRYSDRLMMVENLNSSSRSYYTSLLTTGPSPSQEADAALRQSVRK